MLGDSMENGYVQIYTGNGKGKTTAALGLALRGAGRGLSVFIGQFAKGMAYGEHTALSRFTDLITIEQFGRDCFIRNNPTEDDIKSARAGWERSVSVVLEGKHDIVILDEIGIALYYGLVELDEVKSLIEKKPRHVELILTGRKIPEELFTRADLVTEMKEIRHYYNHGIQAREGIEF